MLRWYVMPAEVVAVGSRNIRRPEHLAAIFGVDAFGALQGAGLWGWIPVKDNWGIGWVDLNATDHATYNAASGVLFLTADLDATLSAAQVSGVQTRLVNRNLPSAWVGVGDTWRQVIKRIYGFIQCLQRYYGESKQNFNVGVPVTTLIAGLPQAARIRLDTVANTLSLPAVDHESDTVETLLMRWADELVTRPVFVGGHQTLGQVQL